MEQGKGMIGQQTLKAMAARMIAPQADAARPAQPAQAAHAPQAPQAAPAVLQPKPVQQPVVLQPKPVQPQVAPAPVPNRQMVGHPAMSRLVQSMRQRGADMQAIQSSPQYQQLRASLAKGEAAFQQGFNGVIRR